MPLLSINKTYQDGDILFEADLDNICDSVESFVNAGTIDDVNFQSGLLNGLTSPGMIVWYGNATPPSNWLVCDGSTVNKVDYPDLYAVIGDTFGPDVGSTFTLPDFRRRVPMGAGGTQISGPANTLGSTGGAETHALSLAEFPSHTHDDSPGHTHGQTYSTGTGSDTRINVQFFNGAITSPTNTTTNTVPTTQSTGGDGAHNNIQPSLVSNFIIRV